MRLLLSMLTWPDGASPEVREIDEELAIGRGRESGWALPDPNNTLSRRHCLLTPFNESWRVTDLSLNGTFINGSDTPLGREQSHELHDGDRIRIGGYVIEARYQTPAGLRNAMPDFAPGPAMHDDRFPAAPNEGWQAGGWDARSRVPGGFAAGFDPESRALPGDFVGQPSGDHSPATSDAWHAPPPGRVVLPDDWDLETPLPKPPPSAPPRPAASVALPDDWDLEAEPMASRPPVAAPSVAGAKPGAAAAAPVAANDSALLAALLRGAGLRDTGGADPATMMESVGGLLRVMVDRLRAVQIDRAAIQREFRIVPTSPVPGDNNPIRYSASTDAALQGLLAGRRPPAQAVTEVLDEIRLHEFAMIAAMRDAVHELLDQLSPARIRSDGMSGMLPLQRRARAFEQYEALHAKTVQALTDDFDSVFGKAFARAYERVAHDDDPSLAPIGRRRR